jgi:hypothetical protein
MYIDFNILCILLLVLFFLVLVCVVAYYLQSNGAEKTLADKSDVVSEKSQKEIKKWFCDEMQSFESKILAFCIDEELRNKKLSYELESELKKKYGNQSLMPLLYHMDLLEKLQRVSPTINQVTLDNILQELIEEYWHDNFAPVGEITLDNLKEQMATLKKSEAEKIISALINK